MRRSPGPSGGGVKRAVSVPGAGSCSRGWARSSAIALCIPAPSRGSVFARPSSTTGASGGTVGRAPSSQRDHSRISSALRRTLRCSAPSKSGGVAAKAASQRVSPCGRSTGRLQWPVLDSRWTACACADGNGVPASVTGRVAPGRSVQSRSVKSCTAAVPSGQRDSKASPPHPGNAPQPWASPGPPRRPSPSRSRSVASPLLGRGAKWCG